MYFNLSANSSAQLRSQYFTPVGVPKTPGGPSRDAELEAEVIAYLREAIEGF
jgi:hypothetical protein